MALPPVSAQQLQALLRTVAPAKRLFVLTGAGISTEQPSGIPDYRSPNGSYSKGHKPITWQQFSKSDYHRKRYWARSMAGWPFMSSREPNAAHQAVTQLQSVRDVSLLLTQNVDGLHQKAGATGVCELHGGISRVACSQCRATFTRDSMQTWLNERNPPWATAMEELTREGERAMLLRQRADGDLELDGGLTYESLEVPGCLNCGGMLKPDVVLFGENVPDQRVTLAMDMLQSSDCMLVAGSACTTFSAIRFVREAARLGMPICLLNHGPTRADELASLKLEVRLGSVLPQLVGALPKC